MTECEPQQPEGYTMLSPMKTLLPTVFWIAAALAAAAEPARLAPSKENGQLLLFDAGRHALSSISTYTARWKPQSDLAPAARAVNKDGRTWVEFSFHGSRGMACATLFFQTPPEPDKGLCYRGLELDLDCDRDDYPHIGVNVVFADKSQLTHDLTLDRGRHTYLIERGFRREKHAPPWEQLVHVMITLDAERHTPDLVYRLARMTMRQVPPDPRQAARPAADRFAEPLLVPEPKQLAWQKGTFSARKSWPLWLAKAASERTRRTAELFADQHYGYTGCRPPLTTFDGPPPTSGIVLRLDAAAAKRKPQGYTLSVEPERVVIAGADEPGLYYGTLTFFQLLKHSLKNVTATLPVPCAQIVDWPDTPNRMLRLEHPHTFRNMAVKEKRGIDYLIEWTDRCVAGNKFNLFYLDISANVQYQRRPEFNSSDKLYSLADLRRFAQFCRDRFIDLCPAWQIGGHANWWLTIGFHPELRERGWPSQGDVTHPDHDAIVYDCLLDVVEALQPKYLSPKSDEWWHERKPGETAEPLLHGKTRAQAFLDSHVKLNAWLRQRGITMMIYEDMLSPYHNGKRFDTYKVIDAFPKDIILTHWSGGQPDKEIRYFTDRGFRVWPNATGLLTLGDESRRRVMGFGKGIYSFGNDKSHLLDEYSPLWSLSTVLRTADACWNFAREERVDPARLVALEHILAIGPNPRAGERVDPLDLSPAFTHSFSAVLQEFKPETYTDAVAPPKLPSGERAIGFIPTRFAGGAARDCLVLRKTSAPVDLPVRGQFASLVFLHTGFVNDPHDKSVAGVRVREWIYGWPCGNYVVHYADGQQAVLPVRLTGNIKRFDTAADTRSALDCRYAWPLDDAPDRPVHLFQWEWTNPRPDAQIVRVTAEHDRHLDVSLIVVAVSGRTLYKQ